MKSNATIVYSLCLVVGDFLALVAAFIGGYLIRGPLSTAPVAHPIHAETYVTIFVSLLPFWILVFALLGLYNSNIYEKRFAEAGRLLIGAFIGLLFVTFWSFLQPTPIFPSKLVPIYSFALGFVLVVILRNFARLLRTLLFRYEVGLTNVLIIGKTAAAEEIMSYLANRRSGYRIIGVIGAKPLAQTRSIASFTTFKDFLAAQIDGLDGIIQTELYTNEEKNREILEYAQQHHVGYRFVPGNSDLFVGNLEVELFKNTLPIIAVHRTPLFGWGRVVKRSFDLIGASLILIVASPLFLIIALLVRFSGKSIFFRQTRLTRRNQEFRVYKFRSMYEKYCVSPEEGFAKMGRPDLLKQYRKNGDYLPNDPRITPIGRFLRATSLDELPQLFNVIAGDLSLVGPRALVPQELSVYEKRHTILAVPSGITGLAQVSGRKDINFDERRQLDLYYVQNWSFWLDLMILAKTLRVILKGS